MNFAKSTRNWSLLLILVLGFVLRTINLTVGFPVLYASNDEAVFHLSALNMLASKTPFTLGNYAPLGSYMQIPFLVISYLVMNISGKINSLSDFEFLLVTHEGYFLFIPRIISALFGTLSIIVVYFISKELFKKKEIAVLGALLTALSLNLVHISHLARSWSPAMFFSLASVFWALKAISGAKRFNKYFTISLILASVSFGFHQFGGLIILLLFLLTLNLKFTFAKYLRKVFPLFSVFVFLVFIFNHFSLGNRFFSVLDPNSSEINLIEPNTVELLKVSNVIFREEALTFTKRLFLTDFIIIIFFLAFFLQRENLNRKTLSILIFTLINFLLVAFLFPPFIRYFLIAFSLMPILAGYTFYQILKRVKFTFLIFLVVVCVSSFNSLYFNLLISKKPTFIELREWLKTNISPSELIIATTHRNLGYVPNSKATEEIRKVNPGYYLRAANLVGNSYPENVRNIVYANELSKNGGDKINDINRALVTYRTGRLVVDSYYSNKNRLIDIDQGRKYILLAHFSPTGEVIYQEDIPEALFDSSYIFPLFRLKRPGPYFDVLEVVK